ncbi:hypothetical protein BST13_02275 [Mycobacterium aquaticum]|uniref:Uncharacterized protein n=2 Tax=Mycobacterium aquaticum TaxID=1927124 RepID=A0A1X0B9Z1_9MYCO|nr:hypothetical protein BST13_02275 [Mycobacterium aquaticum]
MAICRPRDPILEMRRFPPDTGGLPMPGEHRGAFDAQSGFLRDLGRPRSQDAADMHDAEGRLDIGETD